MLGDLLDRFYYVLTGRWRGEVGWSSGPVQSDYQTMDDIASEAGAALAQLTAHEQARFAQGLAELEAIERDAFEAFLQSPVDEFAIWTDAEAKMQQVVERYRRQPAAPVTLTHPVVRIR